jgi:hypothetical protein
MPTNHATRSSNGRATFDAFDFRTAGGPLPLHLHVRCWRHDAVIASLLVYAPTLGQWFEGDEMPADVRAYALAALANYLGHTPGFAFTSAVQP